MTNLKELVSENSRLKALLEIARKNCKHDFDEKCSPFCRCEYCGIEYSEVLSQKLTNKKSDE